MQQFTYSHLTYEGDRLPAPIWCCKEIPVLAGLQSNNLIEGLLWYAIPAWSTERDRLETRRSSTWRAPTWSWASIEGQVSYNSDQYKLVYNVGVLVKPNISPYCHFSRSGITFTVLAAECFPATADPTGAVSGGYLLLKGRPMSALMRYGSPHPNYPATGDPYTQYHPGVLGTLSNYIIDEIMWPHIDYDLIEAGLSKIDGCLEVYLLPLATIQRQHEHFNENSSVHSLQAMEDNWALILRKHEETFERIGIAMIGLHHATKANSAEMILKII
ncbi:hypothetical protein ACMFMG_001216 [Clarireedia jacksonii]